MTPFTYEGSLVRVSLPCPLIVVAQFWPSALVVAGALGLSVHSVFVMSRFMSVCLSLFKGKAPFELHDVDEVHRLGFPDECL